MTKDAGAMYYAIMFLGKDKVDDVVWEDDLKDVPKEAEASGGTTATTETTTEDDGDSASRVFGSIMAVAAAVAMIQ